VSGVFENMDLATITPLILTWNEEPNIARCLDELRWATRVVVIDSGSTDATLEISGRYPNVEVVTRAFDNHTDQWNFGLDQVTSPWVLSLDADYILNEAFVRELAALPENSPEQAWYVPFQFRIFGRPLRGSLYPPRAALFERVACRYIADGHTQTLAIHGPTESLRTCIGHDDRKPLARWLDSQFKYARLEADKLASQTHPASLPDRLRKMIWPAAPAAFVYTLLVKGVILDGWPGWFYVLQRTYAELVLSLVLLEKRIYQNSSPQA
jgi:glycosyltransferase involved in cell wall biosynthesis